MNKEQVQTVAFEIISALAKPKYDVLNAMREYRQKKISAQEFGLVLKAAEKAIGAAGAKHLSLIQAEAQGTDLPYSLILMHAEDQYMTLQLFVEALAAWVNP